jgi:signal transduction histidine kinase
VIATPPPLALATSVIEAIPQDILDTLEVAPHFVFRGPGQQARILRLVNYMTGVKRVVR